MKHIALYGVGRTMKGVALVLGRSGSRVTAISPTQDNATMLKNEVISYLEDGSCPEPFLPDDLLHEMRDYQKCIDRIDFTSDLTAVSSREIQMVIEVLPDDLDEPGLLVNRLVIELLKERKRIVQDKTATVEEVDDIFRIAFRTDLSLKDLEETLGPISIQRLLSRRP
uniref:Uncharacterized protein n=1 Tax=Plectus sambesii TaxID=2011161 RepID=A0A914V8A7_9BILA